MKNILIPVLFYFSIPAFSQTKTAPIKILYNANWEVIESGTPTYTSKVWKDGEKWHKQDFYYAENKIQMDGVYGDKDFKIPDGKFTWYYENGKISRSCLYVNGKREGKWLCYDSLGAKLMMVQFQADSLIATTCVDTNGNAIGGSCIYERMAEFRGGADGWRRFLEQNLQYPKYAQKKNITGVVRVQFMVSKTGEVSDVAILSSPHESLSKEVLRLISISPKWTPAIQLNKPVIYRHIQSVTFRLE